MSEQTTLEVVCHNCGHDYDIVMDGRKEILPNSSLRVACEDCYQVCEHSIQAQYIDIV